MQVGILDTDSGFVHVLVKRLEAAGVQHRVIASPRSHDALVALRLSAMIVDPAVLGPAAWSYLEGLCARMPNLGLVVCTAPVAVAQRVRGLRLGADDWLTKPCHPEEVVARLEAVGRRRSPWDQRGEQAPVEVGGLSVRPDRFQAYAGDASADLTRREFELIQLLAGREGQVLPREEIYERVWGYSMAHGDRSVDVFVRKLRQKLEKVSPGWRYIHTHFGIGYRFAAEPAVAAPAVEPERQGGVLLSA
ncbi:MAG TPA: response regulator transcription factor [Solirubrobacteraceae bacterium]|nr:response regulator transcription factor [Solirubrobacteraceae bacterium]